MKRRAKVQSLAIRVERRTIEPQVVVYLLLVVAQVLRSFLRSVLPASKCRSVAARKAAEASLLRLGHLDILLMKWAAGVRCGMVRRGAEC